MKLRPRKNDRVRHLREVSYLVAHAGPTLPGHTIDLSPNGVRLFCDRSLPVGETVELIWSGLESPVTVGGQVIDTKVDLEGVFAGVRFHKPLSPQVFPTLCGARGRADVR